MDQVTALYRALGGSEPSPQLRPGAWDLAFAGGLIVELDEELHFNRYRRQTLAAAWGWALPWRDDYLMYASTLETECLHAGTWGRRWTSPSCEKQFGPAGPLGALEGNGAPRWKQRALYDAIKDAAALNDPYLQLARVATADLLDGIPLGAALDERATVNLDALKLLVTTRTLGH